MLVRVTQIECVSGDFVTFCRFVTCSFALSLVACAPQQRTTPRLLEETVETAAVFATELSLSNTFYTTRRIDLFRRVLVSPNIVFPAARNSEASVASSPAPSHETGSGDRVEVRLSTLLLDYLAQHGAMLVVPAALPRWSTGGEPLATSWVERGILAPKLAASDESSHVPTVLLAVRSLGQSSLPLAVVAVREPDQDLVVRPRSLGSLGALCLWTADVPVVSFSAEVIDPEDGRLVARVDEHRVPRVRSDFERTIIYSNGAASLEGDMIVGDGGDPAMCMALRRELQLGARDVAELAGESLELTVAELLRSTLDPLLKP